MGNEWMTVQESARPTLKEKERGSLTYLRTQASWLREQQPGERESSHRG